jgi:hypothetical protein
MLGAREFIVRPRVGRLLQFLVEESIRNGFASINQSCIATHALGLGEGFNPTKSGAVRAHMTRLRKAIACYFEGPGRHDPVRFVITPGPYRLIVSRKTGSSDDCTPSPTHACRREWPTLLLIEPRVSGSPDGPDGPDDSSGVALAVALQVTSKAICSTLATVSGPILRKQLGLRHESVVVRAAALGYDFVAETVICPDEPRWTVRLKVFDCVRGDPVDQVAGAIGPCSGIETATDLAAQWISERLGECLARQAVRPENIRPRG